MKISKQMREYFVSDTSLPIQVLDDPYFEYYLNLIDPYYGSLNKYNQLCEAIEFVGGEETFMQFSRAFRNDMTRYIETTIGYQNFIEKNMSAYNTLSLDKGNLYQIGNNGINFASIDLCEANFQSLKFVDPSIVDNCSDYESFAKKFTDIEYLIKCKKIRQVIFGNLCPQRQQTIQKYIIFKIQECLMKSGIWITDICSTSSDEIIFKTSYPQQKIIDIVEKRDEMKEIRLKTRVFKLSVKGTSNYSFFLKTYEDGSKEIKKVDSAYIPEVIKFLNSLDVTNEDRFFIREGRLCQFKDSLF